jgi:hypothetical protein
MAKALALGALIAGLGLLAAGCGSSSTPSASAAATTTTGTNAQARARFGAGLQAFQTCLQQHGVTVLRFSGRRPPTGTAPTTTTTTRRPRGFGFQRNLSPAQQKAFQTCRAKLPQGGFGFRGGRGPNRSGPPANNPAFAKYTQCLAKHGVKFGQTSNRSAFAKAQTACRSLLPSSS